MTVSLADLTAAGVRLRPDEAVTLVHQLTLKVERGEVAGVPSPHVIRLSPSGAVSVEGPVAADGRSVAHAAQLLETLLPPSDAGTSPSRVPGGLKLVLARALRTLDLPPFPSLAAFAEALSRFAAPDPAAAVGELVARWMRAADVRPEPAAVPEPAVRHVGRFVHAHEGSAVEAAPDALTVSDIRRARRATGMRLAVVAERSQIPVGLLRQLEWGYLRNWPAGREGHLQLIRYARTTGLDEQIVVSTVGPLIQEQAERQSQLVHIPPRTAALAPAPLRSAGSAGDGTLVPAIAADVTASPPARRGRWAGAAAAALALAMIPLWWSGAVDRDAAPAARQAEARPAVLPPETAETVRSAGDAAPQHAGAPRPEPADEVPAADAPPVRHDEEAPPAEPASDMAPVYRLAADGVAYSPSFASVGSAVFFHGDPDGPTPLMRADTDSQGAVLRITSIVDDDARNFHVRPSPDGRMIAFDSDRDGERGVYVADADGTNVRRVSGEGFAAVPSWSPDSSTLAFVRADPARSKVWNLWTIELETGELKQLTRFRYGQPWGGSWFPDGRRIAYSHEDRLIIRELDTGRERVFNTPRKGRLVRTPAVSPDGERIMFQLFRDGAWLLELRDGSMRRVLDDPTAEEFTWAPDGKRVAFHSRRSGGWSVWVMAPR